MAKRAKPKAKEIKSSPLKQVRDGQVHRVVLIDRGAYLDAKCDSCGRGAICGGQYAEESLKGWGRWHAAEVEFVRQNETPEAASKPEAKPSKGLLALTLTADSEAKGNPGGETRT